ncbi:hypothetical protein OIU78_008821 [Salix suchowensis]|nr:hypothetical protein OIU78_008821 [Salix suchowensis]
MGGLKLPPQTLHGIHCGRRPLIAPFSKHTFTIQPNYSSSISTGFAARNVALYSPSIFPCGYFILGGAREKRFGARSTKASVQPVTEELVEDKTKENPVSGDAIRRRFLEFYASRSHKVLPSASLVPDDPTVLLTIAGMLQFKPIFLGKAPRQVPRATTAQKFLEITSRKKLLNGHGSFRPRNLDCQLTGLWVSVYEDDDEAFEIWHDEVGVPAEHIKRMGEEDNFWTSGATGPCGPCSELYYDFHPERGYKNTDLGDDSRFIEFYNLVFMQYNKMDDGSLEPLKQKNIDTGLGLERLARILQKVPNNYETDLIYPIIEKAAELANISYALADDRTKMNLKIVGDHLRAIVYLISDGVLPSNIGRGYVVRRLIRRAVRIGRLLGVSGGGEDGAFLPAIAEKVIEMSPHIDPDVKARGHGILDELQREELRFVQTLERGEKLLDQMLAEALINAQKSETLPCLSGKEVFLLYDTFGFPVEITTEVAGERGVKIDMDVENGGDLAENVHDTEFLGYDTLSARAVVESLLLNGKSVIQVSEGSEVEVLLNKTPFYAESGGQIGDHGFLYVTQDQSKQTAVVEIKDVQKSLGSVFVHKGTIREGVLEVGREVEAAVDAKLRQRAKVHHTATHLLQSALKKVIGQETSQAGSLVAFDRLRFDFNFHRPLLDGELEEIEKLINGWIGDGTLLQTKVMSLNDAKESGAIAMFGEKYGEQVRVVEVPGVSMELCGGTHVSNTSEIRAFKIISEQGIASGIRRIEAVAGRSFH